MVYLAISLTVAIDRTFLAFIIVLNPSAPFTNELEALLTLLRSNFFLLMLYRLEP